MSDGKSMPYVNIEISRGGITAEQNTFLITEVTKFLERLLVKNPETMLVVIDEVDTDNWGIGGQSVTSRRQRSARYSEDLTR
jgi:4-oxalocrotonate tautomerase